MTTKTSPPTLMSMTTSTLTVHVASLFLSELKSEQTEWVDPLHYAELETIMADPFYMRLTLCYLLPTERDRCVAIMTFGLAGPRMSQRAIADAFDGHPDMRVHISTCSRIQRELRRYLVGIFALTTDKLDALSTDCLAMLDLEDRTRTTLFRLDIKRVSQLTTMSARELLAKHGVGAHIVNDVHAALVMRGLTLA